MPHSKELLPADQEMRPTDADPRAYSIIVRYEKIESEWYYAAHCTELPDAHVYERSSCEAYASMLMIIEDLQEHHRDCRLPFPEPLPYRRADDVMQEYHNLDDVAEIKRLNWTLEFAKQAQLTAEAETTKAMAAHAIEVAQLREEITRLRTAIDQVHNARLTWAMVCACPCQSCEKFYEFVRDALPDCSDDVSVTTKGE